MPPAPSRPSTVYCASLLPINFFSVEGSFYVFDHLRFEETIGCTATPRENCVTSVLGGSKLKIKDGKLSWKLSNGNTAVPDDFSRLRKPDGGLALCIYDETAGVPSLVSEAIIPPDSDLWTETSKGFKYKNKEGVPDGVTKAKLKAGESGSTKLLIKGENMSLPVTPLNQDPAVRIQLAPLRRGCFENTFVAPAKKNDAKIFKAVEN